MERVGVLWQSGWSVKIVECAWEKYYQDTSGKPGVVTLKPSTHVVRDNVEWSAWDSRANPEENCCCNIESTTDELAEDMLHWELQGRRRGTTKLQLLLFSLEIKKGI